MTMAEDDPLCTDDEDDRAREQCGRSSKNVMAWALASQAMQEAATASAAGELRLLMPARHRE
jgi:hypothetical protein